VIETNVLLDLLKQRVIECQEAASAVERDLASDDWASASKNTEHLFRLAGTSWAYADLIAESNRKKAFTQNRKGDH